MVDSHKPAKVFLDAQEVIPVVQKYRKESKTIVLTQGVFDLVHIGHARYCDEAKKYGDILIVGVDSDEKVRHRKGPDRPIVPQEERLEMLTYLRSVDAVVLKELNAPKLNLIKLIQPDVLVVTRDNYTDFSEEKRKAIDTYCGRVVVLDPMATTSTSAKIRRLQIGAAKKIGDTLSAKLVGTIEEVLKELKGETPEEEASKLLASRKKKK
ncbi:adenylyltransferase/cytidyltransferase family protein [Patescibacteria group bacterium]|nr:adenylyltransferase/cytidyltransferase family protein [Patescibacteria group bacterium]